VAQINFARKTLTCKVVYCGPGLSGKTTNLEYIYGAVPRERRGELTSIATQGDRTIFYDYLPLNAGEIGGMASRLQLFTVPGQPFYAATRKLVLVGVDGVVFVADSQRERLKENRAALVELEQTLAEQNKQLADLPLVFVWNKRDLANALPVEELEWALNRRKAPSFEAVSVRGEGVVEALKEVTRRVFAAAHVQYGGTAPPSEPRSAADPGRALGPPPPARGAPPQAGQETTQERAAPGPAPAAGGGAPLARTASGRRPLIDSRDAATISVDPEVGFEDEDVPAPTTGADRAIGQVVGGCVVLTKLGEGGMGSVYLARHETLGTDFVVKTLKPTRSGNPVSVKRFFAEARATARLAHENVVQVQDVGTTKDGLHYMIMQYVDGETLEARVKEGGRMEAAEALGIVGQIARALKATHAAGVIHRDVKPQNIILTRAGQVKLIDFGLARDVSEQQRLTRPGGIVGTPAYMAPEVIARSGQIDGRVDLFALGLTTYFLLTGETPFSGTDIHDLFLGKARLQAPEVFAPDLPGGYRLVLERLLAHDRETRYASADALLTDLRRLEAGQEPHPWPGLRGERFWLWEERLAVPPEPEPLEGTATAELSPGRTTAKVRVAAPADNPLVREIELAHQNPGNRVGGCLLLTLIDQTPLGSLHRAWDTERSRLVAVRILEGFHGVDLSRSGILASARRLDHPHIPKLHRFGVSDEGELYLVLELVRGRTLSSFRFKPKRVVMAMRDVARALEAAGKRGTLHRNLQPGSVLIDEHGKGHALDFGLGDLPERGTPGWTRYRAPEVLRGRGDRKSEVYALGATLYFGLARQPPGTGEIVPPRRLRGGIPKPVQEICLKCLRTGPAERYPTPGALADALEAFLATGPPGAR
jgi:serine/threonine protein kinase/signal recognition particle receptor subunit beta